MTPATTEYRHVKRATSAFLGFFIAGVFAATVTPAQAAQLDGPPPALAQALTPNGRVLWNLDALLNDTFGNRVECYRSGANQIFSVSHGAYCPGDSASVQQYVFTFLNASHSEFKLVRLSKFPNTGATSGPLRVGALFVSCPGGEYHHGGRGWLVRGGGAGPNGEFWCN
jgi:hypothetical protein